MFNEGDATTEQEQGAIAESSWCWDTTQLLYAGGSAVRRPDFTVMLTRQAFGAPIQARLPLIEKMKDVIDGRLRKGGSPAHAKVVTEKIRTFYKWADTAKISLTLDNVAQQFLGWTDYSDGRRRAGEIKARTVYGSASRVASVLNEVFERDLRLIKQSRLVKPPHESPWRRHGADIEQAFQLGHALCDISEALTVEAIRGRLPISISFRTGQHFEHWCGKRDPASLKSVNGKHSGNKRVVLEHLRDWEMDTSLRTRHSVVNLRIEAEMLIFIAQTGMNWTQVRKLKVGRFAYQSHSNGYLVRRIYKDRRQGEVAFEIFSEYRPYLERYMVWRSAFFPSNEEDLLFPLIGRGCQPNSLNGPCDKLGQLRIVCEAVGVKFIVPRVLRKVRINWLVRRSRDLDQTAEMSQHTKQVLLRNYLEPDPDVAAVEVTRYFQQAEAVFSSPGPGGCENPNPEPLPNLPPGAPRPDCVSPAGCLFCSHQRDIDSADHVWSMVSYRHLKTIELATYRPSATNTTVNSAAVVVDQIAGKVELFRSRDELGRQWVDDAVDRVREGDYHPMWEGFIEVAETLL